MTLVADVSGFTREKRIQFTECIENSIELETVLEVLSSGLSVRQPCCITYP
jgi:hypothetical protein